MPTRQRRSFGLVATALTALALTGGLSGCMKRKLKPLNPCLVSGVVAEVAVTGVDKVDILFVIDSSKSMIDEQDKLRDQIPKLVETLASGVKTDPLTGEVTMFPPAKDMHLGVVTTDMGAPGAQYSPDVVDIFRCSTNNGYGDDGILRTGPGAPFDDGMGPPWAPTCAQPQPPPSFIDYTENQKTPTEAANELGCLAQVGPGGCGFEMQLEAPLKALWPALDIDPETGKQYVNPMTRQPDNRYTFLSTTPGATTLGHGDGINAGFLRNDVSQGISLVAIILVTDEEDCSSRTTEGLNWPPTPGSKYEPVASPNLLCVQYPENLWPTERYVQGYKALRPGNENLVIFAAIAGVPQYLVEPDVLDQVDFDDDASRKQFYDGIRADPNMMPTLNAGGDNLRLSCQPNNPVSPTDGAFPPLRILDVVEGFGPNGVIQSICQDNFGPAVDSIIDVIAKQLGAVCLPRQLVRDAEGMVGCRVVWELPNPTGAVPQGTPTSCDQVPYLNPPEEASKQVVNGRARCVVDQLPVVDENIPSGEGWYYDDFSTEVMEQCRGADKQRIAFSTKPPNGVNVKLECLNEVQSVPQTRTDLNPAAYAQTEPPSIGTKCSPTGNECDLQLVPSNANNNQTVDKSLFCHPQLNLCVKSCTSDSECPKAWVCDDRAETVDPEVGGAGQPICVNPTCGTG